MAHGLNPAQRDAVETRAGPLLVLAGAGTGKTRVVTFRIAELIRNGTQPTRILGVTFTNKAAAEMKQRIRETLGNRSDLPEISTFHSHCVRVLRRNIQVLGYPANFSIYDRGDQLSIARSVLREIRVSTAVLRPDDLLSKIGGWKSDGVRHPQASSLADCDQDHLVAVAYRRYQNSLKAVGAVDFDDLLLLTDELFTKQLAVRRAEAGRFDHILIDEYQDTSHSQYRIVKFLALGHRNLCVVGDDDQSIYGWRGAKVEHILQFKKDWPDAKVVRLQENYRSTNEILTVANRLIRFNKNRLDKTLTSSLAMGERPTVLQFRDETKEAAATISDIRRRLNGGKLDPRDFAILFRTNEQPRIFEAELRRADLPYALVGGTSFFDRKEVRDVVAYLKVLVAPHDEISMLRIINTPPRGIGQKTVAKILQHAVTQGAVLWDCIEHSHAVPGIPPAASESLTQFRKLIQQLQSEMGNHQVASSVQALIEMVGYEKEIERLYPDPQERQARWAAVEEIVNAAANYQNRHRGKSSLQGFLDELTVAASDMEPDKEKDLKQNAIALMTLHSAKGLEFPHVYMVGVEEGILPHHRSLKENGDDVDEERRLCYVGITRAQQRLTLSLAQTRMKWGKPRPSTPSRFLYELTGQTEREV